MEDLIEAHLKLIKRYYTIIEGHNFPDRDTLLNFCIEAKKIKNPDKLSRWVGYLQGILIEREILYIEIERELSRNIYKPIYEKMGYDTTSITV